MSVQPKAVRGLRVPLFDRLVDSAPEVHKEVSPLRLYGREEALASIARDLQRLLNTRRADHRPLRPGATVLDYGVPSITHLSPASDVDLRTLAGIVQHAIQAFEPRVQHVRVSFASSAHRPREVMGSIACTALLGSYAEPVTFPVLLHGGEGEVQVLAASEVAEEPRRG